MKTKKRVRDEAVHIPLCMTNGEAICAKMIPGGHCFYSDVCPVAENTYEGMRDDIARVMKGGAK